MSIEAEVERIAALPYTRELIPYSDGSWYGKIAELPGCMTEGRDVLHTMEMLDDAMRAWIRVKLEDDEPIPGPIYGTKL